MCVSNQFIVFAQFQQTFFRALLCANLFLTITVHTSSFIFFNYYSIRRNIHCVHSVCLDHHSSHSFTLLPSPFFLFIFFSSLFFFFLPALPSSCRREVIVTSSVLTCELAKVTLELFYIVLACFIIKPVL